MGFVVSPTRRLTSTKPTGPLAQAGPVGGLDSLNKWIVACLKKELANE